MPSFPSETVQKLFRCPPGEPRRHDAIRRLSTPGISLLLPYRAPYDWPAMIHFLQARAIPGLEVVTGQTYARIIELDGAVGSIEVNDAPEKAALCATVHFPNLNALPKIIARLRHLFDLGAVPAEISSALSRDPALAPLVEKHPGLRVPGAWDGLEIAIRAVLGQQVTVRAATVLAGKIVLMLGQDITNLIGVAGLTHTFPAARHLTLDAVAAIGLPRVRATAIAALASAAHPNPALFEAHHDLEDAIARLRKLSGIGEWTAQYIALRVLRESDAFLAADVALQRICAVGGQRPRPGELLARAECWRPWRAYAVLHLWTSESEAHLSLTGKQNVHEISA